MIYNYLIAILFSYSGFLFGNIIAKFTKEELREGKRYFLVAENIILGLVFFIIGFNINIFMGILFFLISFYFCFNNYFIKKKVKKTLILKEKSNFVLFSLAILTSIFFSMKNIETIISLVFIYGLISGTLMRYYRFKFWDQIRYTISYPIICIIGFLLITLIKGSTISFF